MHNTITVVDLLGSERGKLFRDERFRVLFDVDDEVMAAVLVVVSFFCSWFIQRR